MASKKPLCHYSGYTKQIQPGDTFNAPDYLVVGSTVGSGNNVHINEKGSTGVWLQFSNDTTGHSLASGFHLGIGGAEDANVRNYSNTQMKFWTDNTHRMSITNTGDLSCLYNASIDGNLVVGGNMTVLGSMNVESSTLYEGSNQFGIVASDIQLLVGQITASGPFTANSVVYVNATGNNFMTNGVTADQWANDDEILAFKSTGDVDHAFTDKADSNTYGTFSKMSSVDGGLWMVGYSEGNSAIDIRSRVTTEVATKSTSSTAAIMLNAQKEAESSVAKMSANANLVGMRTHGSTVWLIDTEGDTWQSGKVVAPNASINSTMHVGGNATIFGNIQTDESIYLATSKTLNWRNSVDSAWHWAMQYATDILYINAHGGDMQFYLSGAQKMSLTDKNLNFPDTSMCINDLRITATSGDNTGAGMKSNMVAGESLVFGDFCYMKSDGKLGKADADAGTTTPTIAMALETIGNNASGDFLLDGFAFDTAWNWTVGSTLYTSVTAGDISHVIPSGSGDQVQVVGIAIHADRIRFSPSLVRVEVT
jgi:hypothetical protein